MRISSFNVNKFCGMYSYNGGYYTPRNIDYITPIKNIISTHLKTDEDIIFLQEFYDNKNIKIQEIFSNAGYLIFHNSNLRIIKSHVVAITLKDTKWKIVEHNNAAGNELINKFIEMKLNDKLRVLSFHNTDKAIKDKIKKYFEESNIDVILGDFNDVNLIKDLNSKDSNYIDLVTDYMITYKPGQTAIDRIFVKEDYHNRIVFNGVIETYTSDHNLLTFLLNI